MNNGSLGVHEIKKLRVSIFQGIISAKYFNRLRKLGRDHLGKNAINFGQFRVCVHKIHPCVTRVFINKYHKIF